MNNEPLNMFYSINHIQSNHIQYDTIYKLEYILINSDELLNNEIYKFKNLKELYIKFTSVDMPIYQLDRILIQVSRLTKLEKLKLGNSITTLSGNIGKLVNLKDLDLSQNNITTLPYEIKYLSKLETIDLSFNFNLNLDTTLKLLMSNKITGLRLENCKINLLPESLYFLTQIQVLDLSNNSISYIDKKIEALTDLKMLYLSNNNIDTLMFDIKKIKDLNYIGLSNNRINYCPFCIESYPYYIYGILDYDLSGNPIYTRMQKELKKND